MSHHYQDKGYLSWIPDLSYDAALLVAFLLLIYWAWTQDDVRKASSWVYSYNPKMQLAILLVLGAMLGVSVGAFGYWAIKRESQRKEVVPREEQSKAETTPIKVKTLHDYFMEDRKETHMLGTRTMIANDVKQTRYDTQYMFCEDFASKTFRLSYFLPKFDNTFLACRSLPAHHAHIVEGILHGDLRKLMEGVIKTTPGEKEENWAALSPSQRVRIYHETLLLDEQIKELQAMYEKAGLSQQFRGPLG